MTKKELLSKYESIKYEYLDMDEIEECHPMWDFMSDVSELIDKFIKAELDQEEDSKLEM